VFRAQKRTIKVNLLPSSSAYPLPLSPFAPSQRRPLPLSLSQTADRARVRWDPLIRIIRASRPSFSRGPPPIIFGTGLSRRWRCDSPDRLLESARRPRNIVNVNNVGYLLCARMDFAERRGSRGSRRLNTRARERAERIRSSSVFFFLRSTVWSTCSHERRTDPSNLVRAFALNCTRRSCSVAVMK